MGYFNDFVLLLIDSCEKEEKESDALRVFIQRSYRWLALMKGALSKRLSDEVQKGLIGELYFLKYSISNNWNKRFFRFLKRTNTTTERFLFRQNAS